MYFKYLESREYKYEVGDLSANETEILSLIKDFEENDNEKQKISKEIRGIFKTSNDINIPGSKEAIKIFKSIDNKKLDIDLSMNDIKDISFKRSGKNKKTNIYEMYFSTVTKNNKIGMKDVKTIYNSRKLLLNSLFRIDRYSKFLLSHGEEKLLDENIKNLKNNENLKNRKFKFRFIDKEDKGKDNHYLRSVVTIKKYKEYDNPIIFYMSLAIIDEMSKEFSTTFNLYNMELSDSKINLSFFQEDKSKIEKDVEMSMGITVINSEIGDGSATFNVSYQISNKENKKITVIDSELGKINHGYKPETIKRNINNISKFKDRREKIIKAINKIKWTKEVNKNTLFEIISLVQKAKLPKKEKDNFNDNKDNIFKGTFDLLELFNRIEEFFGNKDEELKLQIEAEFSDWIENKKFDK